MPNYPIVYEIQIATIIMRFAFISVFTIEYFYLIFCTTVQKPNFFNMADVYEDFIVSSDEYVIIRRAAIVQRTSL